MDGRAGHIRNPRRRLCHGHSPEQENRVDLNEQTCLCQNLPVFTAFGWVECSVFHFNCQLGEFVDYAGV